MSVRKLGCMWLLMRASSVFVLWRADAGLFRPSLRGFSRLPHPLVERAHGSLGRNVSFACIDAGGREGFFPILKKEQAGNGYKRLWPGCACRACLDQLTELLVERERVDGYEVREIVEQSAAEADLAARRAEAGLALL
eukprot:1157587-Pelagomonas_calceolata.AAC.13